MRKKKIDLDVDFMGGLGALTIEEEKSLSDFFKERKMTNEKIQNKIPSRTVKHSKTIA